MKLQDQLDAFRADALAGKLGWKPTDDQLATMEQATAELIDSGQADRAHKAGDVAPEFKLEDAEGNTVSSQALLAEGPLVVSFYRGVWCPYCNLELKALEATRNEFEARGARLVAVSPQTRANSRKPQQQNGLGFPILTDPDGALAAAFGIRFKLPDYLVALYKTFGSDLPAFNNDPSWTLPMPARYVIAPDGVIAYAEINPDYTHRPDPSELLPVLDRLQAAKAA